MLRERGASFFGPLHEAVGGGYPAETVDALWNLVWQGLVTNDTFHALRAFTRTRAPRRRMKGRQPTVTAFRSRRLAPPSAEGRWTLVPTGGPRDQRDRSRPRRRVRACSRQAADATKWAAAVTQQLLARHGVVTREAVAADGVAGGFGIVYPVLKGMEENGRMRRGYFVAGLGATQFALPGALDLLRSLRDRAGRSGDRRAGRHRSGEPVRRDAQVADRNEPQSAQRPQSQDLSADSAVSAVPSDGRRARTDALGRRDGDPRQRRARRLSARAAIGSSSRFCPTPNRIDRGSGARSRAC